MGYAASDLIYLHSLIAILIFESEKHFYYNPHEIHASRDIETDKRKFLRLAFVYRYVSFYCLFLPNIVTKH